MSRALILVVEDDQLQRKLIRSNLEARGYAVVEASSRAEAAEAVAGRPVEAAIVDYQLGRETGIEVIEDMLAANPLVTPVMVTAFGNIERAVEAVKKGAYDFIVKPVDFDRLLLVLERALERHKLRREVAELRARLEEKFSFRNFVFASPAMEEVARLVARASQSDATVLLSGETGTGKELVAKTIHYSSRRKNGPFIAVNLPSLPETLIESELFGSEKGAFTGAHERKAGKFEAADGGTVLLDEIGDMPLHLQSKLLRFLQDREFYRLGSSRPERADVRIIAASNMDLGELTRAGKFRPDLFYRLNVIHITIPPLRERKQDIPPLADFFIRKYAGREGKKIDGISKEAMALLMNHSYPGNVRELENILERAVVFADSELLTTRDLPLFAPGKSEAGLEPEGDSLPEKVRRLEIREIRRALSENGDVKSRAARALGITERMLGYKMKIYGL
jgi:two-component system NtrC family response regulator